MFAFLPLWTDWWPAATTPPAADTRVIAQARKLEPGALLELYVIDLTPLGVSEVHRFHAGQNGLGGAVVWAGEEYLPFPLETEGYERNSQGTLPRPSMRVSALYGLISALNREYGDLVGAKVVRKRVFARFLDAENFPDGNPEADPNCAFPDETWYIDRKANSNPTYVEWELAAPWDVAGVKLPRRQVIQNSCRWLYRGPDCGYTGDPVANLMDEPVATLAEDKCGKRLTSCKLRHGEAAELPIGAFPAAGRIG